MNRAYITLIIGSLATVTNSYPMIAPYNHDRDTQFVHDLIEEERANLSAPVPVEELRAHLAEYRTFMLKEKHDNNIGCVSYSTSQCKLCGLAIGAKRGTIELLAVNKKYRNKHHGSHLLNFAITSLAHEGVDEIWIYVNKNNAHAHEFYRRKGFTEYNVFPHSFFFTIFKLSDKRTE